jgi:hypothetical protein
MTDDLVKRLREVGGISDSGATRWYINPDGPEAADRIEMLKKGFRDILSLTSADITSPDMLVRTVATACIVGAIDHDGKYCYVPHSICKALEGKDE